MAAYVLDGARGVHEDEVGAGVAVGVAAVDRVVEAVTCSASERAMISVSSERRAATAARTLITISSAGITSFPSMWPQRFGET